MIFGSDNQSCASPKVMEMMIKANEGFTHGYGDDKWTRKAEEKLKSVFECDLEAYFVVTGTAANCLALSCLVQPWESVLCHDNAHIVIDESTAPELFTGGSRLIPISNGDGKITPDHITDYFEKAGTDIPHNSLAKALSIAQASEAGLVYTPEEISAISTLCSEKGLKFHMDGARFANAVASLNCTPADLTWKAGVDVLCLGATKCGALCAEAVLFFNKELAETFIHRRKRTGHLLSKGRVFGAQFVGWLYNDHWLELANHANSHAARLAESLSLYKEITIVWPVQANEIFLTMPKDLAEQLQRSGAEFYEWIPEALPKHIALKEDEVFIRLVASFQTNDEHRQQFCDVVNRYLYRAHSESIKV